MDSDELIKIRPEDEAIQQALNTLYYSGVNRIIENVSGIKGRIKDYPKGLVEDWRKNLGLKEDADLYGGDSEVYNKIIEYELRGWLENMWDISQQTVFNESVKIPGDRFRNMFEQELNPVFLGRESDREMVAKIATHEMPEDEKLSDLVDLYTDIQFLYDFEGRKDEIDAARKFFENGKGFFQNKNMFIDAMARAVEITELPVDFDSIALNWSQAE